MDSYTDKYFYGAKREAAQTVFRRVARHLMEQGKPAKDGVNCMYLAPNGAKCAIGCLIDDDNYTPALENQSIEDSIVCGSLMASCDEADFLLQSEVTPDEHALRFFEALQGVHDTRNPSEWRDALLKVAKWYNIDPNGSIPEANA